MTKSKTWTKPELKQLPIDRTLGGFASNTFEDEFATNPDTGATAKGADYRTPAS